MPLGLIGLKVGHTRVYDSNGVLVPVTVVHVGPNRVLQVKTKASKDGYNAVQLGYGDQKLGRLSKAVVGHLAKQGVKVDAPGQGGEQPVLTGVKRIREFRDFSKEVKSGDTVGADLFQAGQFVDAIGTTKGRGFEGVVGRWSFRGGDATHGAKGWHRRSGAIGQRLFPGSEGDFCIIREAKKISIDSARLKQITEARKKAKDAATAKKDDKKAAAKKK